MSCRLNLRLSEHDGESLDGQSAQPEQKQQTESDFWLFEGSVQCWNGDI